MTLREEVNKQGRELADWYIEEVKRLVAQMEDDGVPVYQEPIEEVEEE